MRRRWGAAGAKSFGPRMGEGDVKGGGRQVRWTHPGRGAMVRTVCWASVGDPAARVTNYLSAEAERTSSSPRGEGWINDGYWHLLGDAARPRTTRSGGIVRGAVHKSRCVCVHRNPPSCSVVANIRGHS